MKKASSKIEKAQDTVGELKDLEQALTHFVRTFEQSTERWESTVYPFIKSIEASTKRWERMIYPSMIVLGLLALSGFWLIYSLTQDIHSLTKSVDPEMGPNMHAISVNISHLSQNIEEMKNEVYVMRTEVQVIGSRMETIPQMQQHMNEMNQSMKSMNQHTGNMSIDMHHLNRHIGRPMSKVNDVMPW